MARQGTVIFNRSKCGWQKDSVLRNVTSGKSYSATVYGADERDDLGNAGCGCDYIVLADDKGDRIGFGWDVRQGVVRGGVSFSEDK